MDLTWNRIQDTEREHRDTFNIYCKHTFTKAVEYQMSLGICESIATHNVQWIISKYKV